MIYKDSQNKVHEVPAGYEHLMRGWPDGYTQITKEEVVELLAPTPEQIAEKAQRVSDKAAIEQSKADATVHYLVTHTPQECYDKVILDVTSLTQAKEILGRLAMAVSVLARNQLR